MPTFNLITDPWLPVRDVDGCAREVGLLDALLGAHRWRRIEDPSPLVEAALYRLLLALLHRALEGPRDGDEALELLESGRFPEAPIRAYLQRYGHRFDLFHPDVPFYQVPDLPEKDPLPWTKLLPELASGNNPTLFDHATDDNPTSAPAALAARALLVHQSFTPGGLIRRLGVTAGRGAPLATGAVFLPLGDTLFETLMLNLVPYHPRGDLPIWEREPYRTRDIEGHRTQEPLSGRTRVYTWLTRAVRLWPEQDGTVRWVGYGPGVVADEMLDPDPMCAYTRTETGQVRPVRLSTDRAFWRDFEALLPDDAASGNRGIIPSVLEHARNLLLQTQRVAFLLPLAVVGQVTDQAKVLSVRREVYPFPIGALDVEVASAIRKALAQAKATGSALRGAGWVLARALLAPGGREPQGSDVELLLGNLPLLPQYWSRLEVAFPEFLEEIHKQGAEQAHSGWVEEIRKAALYAWDQTVRSVGMGPRHLKAIEAGERRLAMTLAES